MWILELSEKICLVVMRKIRTRIKGLYILKGKKFSDTRGWLREVFKKKYWWVDHEREAAVANTTNILYY